MGKVLAGITISLDGITGPNDGPGAGLGRGRRAAVIESPFATHLRFRVAQGA